MSDKEEANGISVAIDFLSDYVEFGSQGHLITANALKNAILATDNQREKKLLAARIFSLLMAATEDLAAICISIKHRDDGVGLVFNYLTYGTNQKHAPDTSLQAFYTAVTANVNFSEYLNIPKAEEIHSAGFELDNVFVEEINRQLIARGKAFSGSNHSNKDYLSGLFDEIPLILQSAAQMYLADDKGLVRTYNKLKHGFFVVEDGHIFQNAPPLIIDNSSFVILKNQGYSPNSKKPVSVVEISRVDISDVDKIVNNVYMLSQVVRGICLITASLLEIGIITTADDKA